LAEYVEFEPPAERVGLAVVLPGRAYTPARPLLDFATQACLEAGWHVRQLWWQIPDGHPAGSPDGDPAAKVAWVRAELDTALTGAAGRVLVVGKSLGCFAAPYAAERSLEAVWLTPVLTEPRVADGVQANDARQLLVGGTEDPYWRPDLPLPSGSETLTVAGADHSLTHLDGVLATVQAHLDVMARLKDWLHAAGDS
jgi:hypothetical protein